MRVGLSFLIQILKFGRETQYCPSRGLKPQRPLTGSLAEYVKERIRRYRRYVYEAGAVNRPEKGKTKVIGDRFLEKERKRKFELSPNFF
jgi:hypothetical protein